MVTSIDQMLVKAFHLAYFIHGDKATATQIVTEAMSRLDVAAAAQYKRLYYTPAGRFSYEQSKLQRHRTKVSVSELHLLQRLVYIESETYERRQEEAFSKAGLTEDDMIIRFIKHLVKITIKRNSFYVALGVSRLLYNYTTAETMDIYDLIIQDSDRMRDNHYYRSRKRRLMQEFQERFGSFLRLSRGQHREERFQTEENLNVKSCLIRKCLSFFTPWSTRCVMPAEGSPAVKEISPLSFQGDNPDNEHPIEINRIHSILHPDCYARLAHALKLSPPDERLAIPHFFLPEGEDENRPPSNRDNPPDLTEDDFAHIHDVLNERAARRREVSAGLLSIRVDGVERARMELKKISRVTLEVEEGADLIEVRAHQGDEEILLATHLLTLEPGADARQTEEYSTVLEDGQRVSFQISLKEDADGALVNITYSETHPMRAASLFARRLLSRINPAGFYRDPSAMLKPAVALLLAAVCVAVWVSYSKSRIDEPKDGPLIAESKIPSPSADKDSGSQAPDPAGPAPGRGPVVKRNPAGASNTAKRSHQPPRVSQPESSNRNANDVAADPTGVDSRDSEATRSIDQSPQTASLLSIKKVFVDSFGEDAISEQVRNKLADALQRSGRFESVDNRETADAVFKGTITARNRARKLSLRLIGLDGSLLWARAEESDEGEDARFAERASDRAVRELLAEVARKERPRIKR